ncbi:hypothetical protein [Luteolibacter marinus]|uniref:hypothetical protein n=1 Tax=Luteolibacter marinus TaxID=2776705 RepID=UPI001865AE10|nr:hypothetical protein [Luteolibacter marinus]
MVIGAVNAADGFAMTMVLILILILSLGTVALLLATIFRSGKARPTEVDRLLEELREDEDTAKPPAAPVATEPWERQADWWKK